MTIIVMIIIFHVFRQQQRKIETDCDDFNKLPSDYTIWVKNIPTNTDDLLNNDFDADLQNFFE